MGKFLYIEPARDSNGPIEVYATNPDRVSINLSHADAETDIGIWVSYWQLNAILHRVREAFAYQLEHEEKEGAGAVSPLTDES